MQPGPPLLTPSPTPPVSSANVSKPNDASPPLKRQRFLSPSPPQPRRKPIPTSLPSAATIPPNDDYAKERHATMVKLLGVWSSLAERYAKPIDEDDIVDIVTGQVIQDRGVISSWDESKQGYFTNVVRAKKKKAAKKVEEVPGEGIKDDDELESRHKAGSSIARPNASALLPSPTQSNCIGSDEDLEIYEAQIRQFRAARLTAEASLRDSERHITRSPTIPPPSSPVSSELDMYRSDGPSLFPPMPSHVLLPEEDEFDDELVGWDSERHSSRPPTIPLSSSPTSSDLGSHSAPLFPPIPSPVLLPQEDEFDDELVRWDSERHSSRFPTTPSSSLPASSNLDKYRLEARYLFTPRSSPVLLPQEDESDDELVGCSSHLMTIPPSLSPVSSDLDKCRSDGPSLFPPRSSPDILPQEDESDDELVGCSSHPPTIPPSSSPVSSDLDTFRSDGPSLFPPSSSPVVLPQEDESDDELVGWNMAHSY